MKKQQQLKTEVKGNNAIKRISYMLMIVVAVLFFNTLNHDYNLDDDLVTNNHPLTSKGLAAVGEIFTSSYFVDNMGHAYGYRPVVLFSFALEHQIFGENPAVSHLINVLLYLTLVVSFFRLLNRFFGPEKVMMSALIALIFAVHPIHSEVVASIKNRDEILALLFAVWSGHFMMRYITSRQIKHFFFVLFLFTIGMLAKKSIFPLAFVFPLISIFYNKPSLKEFFLLSTAFLLPAMLIGSELDPIRVVIIGSVGGAILYAVYFFKKEAQIESGNDKVPDVNFLSVQSIISALIIVLVTCVAVALQSPLLMLGLLPFLIIKTKQLEQVIFSLIALSLIVVSKLMGNTVSEAVSLIILLWTFMNKEHFYRHLKLLQWIVFGIGSVVFVVYPSFEIGNLIFLIVSIVFLFLLQIRLLFAVILFLIAVTSSWFTHSFVLPIIMGVYLVVQLLIEKSEKARFDWLNNIVIGCTILLFSFGTYLSLDKNKSINQTNYASQWTENANKSVKEGRPLTYVENTLIKDAGFVEIAATGMYTIGEYIRLMVAPVQLSFYYGFARIKTVDFKNIGVWVSLLAYLSLFLLAWRKRNDRPEITIGILWFAMCIFLFSNWFELVAGMVGERLAFSASAGFSILSGALLLWWRPAFNLFQPKSQDWIIIGLLFVMVVLSVRRNHLWKDRFTLMSHDIEYLTNSAQAHNLYGLALMNAANSSMPQSEVEAIEMKRKAFNEFDRATAIYPNFFNPQFDKGRVLVELRDFASAYTEFKKAYELDKSSAIALEEIIKSGFEAKLHKEVIKYAQIYFDQFQPNELIFELVAYSCLLNRDFERCEQIAEKGNRLFPENPNLKRMITDARNKVLL